MKFRFRVFLYLLLLLALFLASQTIIYVVVEWLTCRTNPSESMWVGLEETAQALGLSLLLVPMLVWIAWRISCRVVAPLRKMVASAERVCDGRWTERIDTHAMPDDETKRLAQAMNAAFDNYTGILQRLERFSGDAAHQLRTPIAAIRNLGEVTLARSRSEAEYRSAMGTMLRELDHMTRLVEQLLQLSQLDADVLCRRFVSVSLRQVVERVQRAYAPLASALHVQFQVEVSSASLVVLGIEDLLIEMLGNLLDNALRHTPEGGTIQVEAAELSSDMVCLTVLDSGPGVAAEYAQSIFDRFVQIPGTPSGAMGLGLALASEIARVHGGHLQLANPGQPGARFECRLPRSRFRNAGEPDAQASSRPRLPHLEARGDR